jgi:hypothetical protein
MRLSLPAGCDFAGKPFFPAPAGSFLRFRAAEQHQAGRSISRAVSVPPIGQAHAAFAR